VHHSNVRTVSLAGLNLNTARVHNGFGDRAQLTLLIHGELTNALKVQVLGNEKQCRMFDIGFEVTNRLHVFDERLPPLGRAPTVVRHILTIEVDMKKRAVIQARGWGDRPPSGRPLRMLQVWIARENLRLAL
jgi:hypothetical protein